MKSIQIKTSTKENISYKDLIPFQGNLKDLSEDSFKYFRHRLIKDGFCEPINVWVNEDKFYVLNGHQRLRVMTKLIEDEGFKLIGIDGEETDALPVVFTKADDYKSAKRVLLSLADGYGDKTPQGLYEFMMDSDISYKELDEFKLDGIKKAKFVEEYFLDVDVNEAKVDLKDLEDQWIVSVECKDEEEMNELYQKLKEMGHNPRLIT